MSSILQCLSNNEYLIHYFLSNRHTLSHFRNIKLKLQKRGFANFVKKERKKAKINRLKVNFHDLIQSDVPIETNKILNELSKISNTCIGCKLNNIYNNLFCGISKHPIDITKLLLSIWQREDCRELANYRYFQHTLTKAHTLSPHILSCVCLFDDFVTYRLLISDLSSFDL